MDWNKISKEEIVLAFYNTICEEGWNTLPAQKPTAAYARQALEIADIFNDGAVLAFCGEFLGVDLSGDVPSFERFRKHYGRDAVEAALRRLQMTSQNGADAIQSM